MFSGLNQCFSTVDLAKNIQPVDIFFMYPQEFSLRLSKLAVTAEKKNMMCVFVQDVILPETVMKLNPVAHLVFSLRLNIVVESVLCFIHCFDN